MILDQPSYERFVAGKTRLIPDNVKVVVALFAGGASWNTGLSYLTIVLVSLDLLMMTLKSGVETQLSQRRYRDYVDVLFMRIGKWKQLAPIEAILVSRTGERSWAVFGALTFNVKSKSARYMVDIITTGDRDVIILNTMDQEAAYELARSLAIQEDVKLYEQASGGHATEISPYHND